MKNYLNMTVIKKTFLVLLIFTICSCARHHDTEELSKKILKSDIYELDSLLEQNRPNTTYYLDSVLNGNKASFYFKNADDYFGKEYLIEKNFNFFKKNYFSYTSPNKDEIRITFRNKKERFRKINFDYKLGNGNWILNYIDILNEN